MRVAIFFFVIAILYFSFHAANCDIDFSIDSADKKTYTKFIQDFRQQLSKDTQKVYNLTVLKHQVALNTDRFLLVNLFNYNKDKITVGIDVFDVYVVGFLTGTNSYIFKNATDLAYNKAVLFPGSSSQNLSYTGAYGDLEKKKASRGDIPLGRGPLDAAITNLFRKDSTSFPRSLIVIIQMVSEAARFKFIESKIAECIDNEHTLKPDMALLSLENNWGRLSKQVQKAQNNGGKFPNPVTLTSSSGKQVKVENVSDIVVQKGMALLKYTSENDSDDDDDEASYLEMVMHDIM